MGFLNITMLFGLAAVAIPILIHLLHRRRYDVVDWGAMQFLQISQTKRRRLLIEELLLLLVRVGLIALIVLALARPFADASLLGIGSSKRLTVLVLDGSYSMGANDGSGVTTFKHSQRWADDLLQRLRPGASTAVIVAGSKPVVIVEPTRDLKRVRSKLTELPVPTENGDWPRAVQKAIELAAREEFAGDATIYLLKDAQRFGWADPDTLARWQQLKQEKLPTIVVNELPKKPALSTKTNYALAPLQAGRALAWVGQQVRFGSALIIERGDKTAKPPRISVEVDGEVAEDLPALAAGTAEHVPVTFSQRFDKPGPHVVALVVQSEPGDTLPGDNRQEIKIDVVESFPVLLIDGDAEPSAKSSTFFLHKALTLLPEPKRPAVVDAKIVPASKFAPTDVTDTKEKPRVLILADVPRLSSVQEQAVRSFLKQGGALLVVAGARVEGAAQHYNDDFYQDGKGWLPARLDQVMGDVARPEQAATLDSNRLLHPAVEAFRGQSGAFSQVRFPRWWKATAGKNALPAMAHFGSGAPFLIEAPFGNGKVILCTAPLDRSWGANFPSMWEYPIFVHEVIAHLADAGKTIEQRGIDLRESDLTPLNAEERASVAGHVPLHYAGEAVRQQGSTAKQEDIWWLFLAGVIAFLCLELWLTRRMATQASQ